LEQADAVISAAGKVEHARGDAQLAPMRAALTRAVQQIERARGPLRAHDADAAIEAWRPLIDARYSLVDHFDSDGRRYLVAVRNDPAAPGPEVLTDRERQVVAAAATGRSNKLIAYELGLGDSTVRVLLSRAAKRLGVGRRRELVALYKAYVR
jgi:DNA-binding NarL/FixJ family response regulator